MPLLTVLGIVAVVVGALVVLKVLAWGVPVGVLFVLVGLALIVVDRGGYIRR